MNLADIILAMKPGQAFTWPAAIAADVRELRRELRAIDVSRVTFTINDAGDVLVECRRRRRAVRAPRRTTRRDAARAARPSGGAKLGRPRRGICRKCGCTDDRACPGGCSWANEAHTLCSTCLAAAAGTEQPAALPPPPPPPPPEPPPAIETRTAEDPPFRRPPKAWPGARPLARQPDPTPPTPAAPPGRLKPPRVDPRVAALSPSSSAYARA